MGPFLIALLLGGAKAPPKPKLQVVLLLPYGFVGRGEEVPVRIRIYDPQRELSCPAWRVTCNDPRNHVSSNVSDCEDRFPRSEERPLVYRLPENGPVRCGPYWAPGEYLVQAEITDSTHGPGQMAAALKGGALVRVASDVPPPPAPKVASR